MLRIAIIDDETNSRSTLRGMLEQFCQGVEVVAEAESVKTGVHALLASKPDLVLLDIQMQDGTGFDLLEMLPEMPFTVIFVTAYDQYALKAFHFSASGYLLKPIQLDTFIKAIEEVKQNQARKQEAKQLHEFILQQKKQPFQRMMLPTQEGLEIISLEELIRCEGDNSYTTFFLTDGRKIIVSKTLKTYSELLTDHGFFRIFVSHLVNLDYIKRVKMGRGGEVVLNDGLELPIARNRRKELLEALEKRMLAPRKENG
jgi:two-component system LytT family response regulator